jgi:CheY-like chemotaxis protein
LLPERSGMDVLSELRSDPATHDIAIVIVTGHPDGLTEAQLADTDGLIVKPFDLNDLLKTIYHAMQRAANRHAEVAPVGASAHREAVVRTWHASGARRTRGRR